MVTLTDKDLEKATVAFSNNSVALFLDSQPKEVAASLAFIGVIKPQFMRIKPQFMLGFCFAYLTIEQAIQRTEIEELEKMEKL